MKKLLLLGLMALSLTSFSQDRETKDTLEIDDFYIDFTVPDISAFSILDIEPNSVSKPGNIKEFSLGLTNYISKDGDLRPGLAVEWAPFMTFSKDAEKWKSKNDNNLKFQWKNILFSAATATDSTNVKLGTAVKFAPIDKTNPFNNSQWVEEVSNYFYEGIEKRNLDDAELDVKYNRHNERLLRFSFELLEDNNSFYDSTFHVLHINVDEFTYWKDYYDSTIVILDRFTLKRNVIERLVEKLSKHSLDHLYNTNSTDIDLFAEEFTNAYFENYSVKNMDITFNEYLLKKKALFKKKNWNKLAVQATYGIVSNSSTTRIEDLSSQYWSAAISAGFPLTRSKGWFKNSEKVHDFFRNKSQLLLVGKYSDYLFEDSVATSSLFTGGRLLIGNSDKRFSVELGYIHQENSVLGINQFGWRYSVGAEFKIMNSYWLEFSVGGQTFDDALGLSILPRLAFRHSFGNESRFLK